MKNLSRATKKQIYKACQIIEKEQRLFICDALGDLQKVVYSQSSYAKDFSNFFEQTDNDFWDWSPFTSDWIGESYDEVDKDCKNARIMALLMYLEARDDI